VRGQFSMKRVIYVIFLLLVLSYTPVFAQCVTNGSYVQQDPGIFVGNTACYPANGPPWTNQEYHTGGNVIDYKLGASSKSDPTTTVGSYNYNSDSKTIQYTYPVGGTPGPTYTVWGPTATNTYDFCNGTSPLPGGVLRAVGQQACPGTAP